MYVFIFLCISLSSHNLSVSSYFYLILSLGSLFSRIPHFTSIAALCVSWVSVLTSRNTFNVYGSTESRPPQILYLPIFYGMVLFVFNFYKLILSSFCFNFNRRIHCICFFLISRYRVEQVMLSDVFQPLHTPQYV